MTRYHRQDTEFTKYAFDYLTLSEPPILEVSSHSSETLEETLVIRDPVLRDFVNHMDRLLGHLLNRMQLHWQHRKKPTTAERKWFEFFYPEEISTKKFVSLYELRRQKDKVRSGSGNANHDDHKHNYKLEIENHDRLIKSKWNDIESNYSCLCTNYQYVIQPMQHIHILHEIYNLMTKAAYPQFLRDLVSGGLKGKEKKNVVNAIII